MAILDELTKKAQAAGEKMKDLAGAAAEKARDAADNAKIKVAILSEQRELEKNYQAIGEWFVSEFEGDMPDAVRDVVAAIEASKGKISELRAQLTEDEEDATPAEEE